MKMQTWYLVLVGLLASASACFAAQISYNIVTDGGAACVGGQLRINRITSFRANQRTVTVTVDTFTAGDVGKYINIPNANLGNNYRTIQSVAPFNGSTQTITLSGNVFATVNNVATNIIYGFDDAPNFKAFNTWARANQGSDKQVVLTIPSGKTCWFGSSQSIPGNINNTYFGGIKNLIVEGSGATMSSTLGSGFSLAGNGLTEVGLTSAKGKSARLKDISSGASTIELTATSYGAGYISRFNVGDWLMISGMDIQAAWQSNYGVPPNHQFFERRQIVSICNNDPVLCPGTAKITLDRQLTQTYLSTWPEWNNGSSGGIDQGGPATAYILNPSWNTTVEYRGVTIDAGQTYAWGRNVIFRNVTWLGCCGTIPTQNETFTAINTTFNGGSGWEVDKLVDVITISGSSFNRIDFQSSSVNSLVMSNSTIGAMFGTPKRTQITDTSFKALRPGAWTNGASTGPFVCTRCAITSFQWDNQGLVQAVGTHFSMSSGVISTANTDQTGGNGPPHRVLVPGANVYYQMNSSIGTIGLFQSGAQTQDAIKSYVRTNETGGFPTFSGYTNRMQTHPATRFTCTDCTGDESLVAASTQSGCAAAIPLGECSAYTGFTFSAPFAIRQTLRVRGKISTLMVDVKTAATAAGNVAVFVTGTNGVNTVKQSNWTTFVWRAQINAKQTGKRVYTYPTGWTCNGVAAPTGCAGDNLGTDPPEQVWIGSGLDFGMTSAFTKSPVVDISATTNQGVVP
jgi:hypothetical protein